VPGSFGLALEDLVDEVVLALGVDLELAPDLAKLGDAHLAEIGDVEVVALSRGLELLHLLELADWCAAGDLAAAAARTAITERALIWTWHLDRGHL
jgi:hypothetical protein